MLPLPVSAIEVRFLRVRAAPTWTPRVGAGGGRTFVGVRRHAGRFRGPLEAVRGVVFAMQRHEDNKYSPPSALVVWIGRVVGSRSERVRVCVTGCYELTTGGPEAEALTPAQPAWATHTHAELPAPQSTAGAPRNRAI